jgi:NTE family protein
MARNQTPYPPPAQILGILLNAVFLDNLDHDADVMQRLNDALLRVAPSQRGELVPVDLLVVRPSEDLGDIAGAYEHTLPTGFRYLLRGWGTQETPVTDSIAMLLFEAEYTRRLIAIGERDGEANMAEIAKLIAGP